MRFSKYNGAGNDFIILNNIVERLPEESLPRLARTLCERHLSIGADGLMVVERSEKADFRMVFFNCDGSVGEMCGNGARCICRYGYENGLSGGEQTVETASGLVYGRRVTKREYRVRLTDPTVVKPEYDVEVDGKTYECGYVELGSPGLPHAAVHMAGLAGIPERELFELGRKLRFHPAFPKGANVNFYELTGPDHFYERTYERGVEDFTYACGTGTASAAIVLASRGLTGDHVEADMAGGRLAVDLGRENGKITAVCLTGPTNTVAEGEVLDEELESKP